MPLSISYQPELQLIRLIGEGRVSMEERRHAVGLVFRNADYNKESNVLIDVSKIANVPTETEFLEVAGLVKLIRSRFTGHIAIVNAQMGHVTVSHLVALNADFDEHSVRVFYSEAEALLWLK